MGALGLWLLATNHAAFELVGVMHHDAAPAADIGQQRWHQVENTLTKQKTELRAKPAAAQPVLPLLDCVLSAVSKPAEVSGPVVPAADAATRAFHTWHFVQRAAPLPGAPSLAV